MYFIPNLLISNEPIFTQPNLFLKYRFSKNKTIECGTLFKDKKFLTQT